MRVFIMRGPSGSGKSHWIKENHPDAVVCSADSFFLDDAGEYLLNPAQLSQAHQECFQAFLMALHNTCSVIVVDNTNLRWWEYMNYILVANMCSAKVHIIQFVPKMIEELKICFERSKHGTPATIVGMQGWNFEPTEPNYRGLFNSKVESLTIVDAGEEESFSLPAGLLEEADKDDNGLDDVVHDIISRRASGINNEGFKAQIEFIIEELGPEHGVKAVQEALEGEHKEWQKDA